MQFRALYANNQRFWQGASSRWEYFLEKPVIEELVAEIERRRAEASQEDATASQDSHARPETPPEAPPKPPPADADGAEDDLEELEETDEPLPPNFGEEYRSIAGMELEERSGLLQKGIASLDELSRREDADSHEVAEALVDTTRDATLVNRATMHEALRMGNEQAQAYTEQIVKETHQLVKSTTRLIDSDMFDDELVDQVVQRSNGTVVQHMTRVFMNGLDFLLFYNRKVLVEGIPRRIRLKFAKTYHNHYRRLLPHIHPDSITLERVFFGGMKALSEVEINSFATGFLLHDVGKADDIEYHEGEAAYNRETVERHVKLGYQAVMNKTKYPREAGLITGYHHEYYGDPAGYGYFREFLEGYRNQNPAATIDFVMSYTMEPLIDYEVMAYFPAKMLEIVDVFDSLTDPNRRYRKPLSTEGALEMIRTEFIDSHLKVDPILFDLFEDFIAARRERWFKSA